jgi:hypothetical protein
MPTLAVLDEVMLRAGPVVPAIHRLGGGAIAMAGEGQPWRVIGLDAAVYQLRQPSGRVVALRCPLSDTFERSFPDRYRALAADPRLRPLREHPAGPFPGEFAFLPDGLLLPAPELRSAPHPVIATDWVMGPTLLQAADRACRAGDKAYLAALADAWLAVVGAIETHGFVHGDLSADNAIVRPGGGIALVDYDAAVWPGSPPAPATRANPNYAHPTGQPQPPVERRDRFAALVVYASLRALAERPQLRPQFGDPTSEPGGALLFSPWDLVDPANSPVFAALVGLEQASSALVRSLRSACIGRADAVPSLAELVSGQTRSGRGGAIRQAPPAAPDAEPAAPRARPAAGKPPGPGARAESVPLETRERQSRLTRLNSLIMAGDDDAAHRYWIGSGLAADPDAVRDYGERIAELEQRLALKQARAAAKESDPSGLIRLWEEGRLEEVRGAAALRPALDAAKRRAAQVERLRQALDQRDMETVARLWPELRGDPLASAFAIRVTDALREVMGSTIAEAVARGDDAALLASVRDAEEAGVPVDAASRRAARAATTRSETRRRLREAVDGDDRIALTDLVLSGRLAELGSVDKSTARAAMRALNWPLLEAALASDDDVRILSAHDAEPDLYDGEGVLTREQRARVDLARSRLYWLNEVRIALRHRDVATLQVAMRAAPPGARERLSEVERRRIERLTVKEDAVARLARALKAGPDRAIVEALAAVRASGATLPEALDWAAVRGVEDRVSLAQALREAATADPPDLERLAVLLPAARAAAREGGTAPSLPDGLDFEQLERDVLRAAQVTRLREAISSGDDAAIAAAASPDPYGAVAALPAPQRARVELALQGQPSSNPFLRRSARA